jgi:hypothetical protein
MKGPETNNSRALYIMVGNFNRFELKNLHAV